MLNLPGDWRRDPAEAAPADNLTLVTAPAEEPVTTAEAKAHLRVDLSDDDTLIAALIVAARQVVESRLSRTLVTSTWDYTLADWPRSRAYGSQIRPPRPPLQSVTWVKYYDGSNALQTYASTNYNVRAGGRNPGLISLTEGATLPTTYDRPDAVTIRYVAGYGAATAVPQVLKQAILLLVGMLYEHREAITELNVKQLPFAVEALLAAEDPGIYA